MTPRVGTTKQAAQHFGFIDDKGLPNIRTFMAWAKANNIQPEHGQKHHLWWNFREIETALDKKLNVKIESSGIDYDNLMLGRLKNGENQREIPSSAAL